MIISNDAVVSIHYTLSDNDGNILDSSSGKDPLHYLHGHGNLIIGMEEGLEGKANGDRVSLTIAPEKGYGEKSDKLIQKVPKSAFGDQRVDKGMQFNTENGHIVTITDIGKDDVTVDGNHPLAGVHLNFEVEVINIRQATKEEVEHGHVHEPGGHAH
ncbi:MAG: peptidylprolyl isomerase [Cyclobacteriaceae bacterium]|nr:peptidylprolyl isomerase [Cyclobacteriaceae bacterium]